jgi:uncharacterized repeat protein (TIGR01451 family)
MDVRFLAPRAVLRLALLTAALMVVLPASAAQAGRLLVTGHDADLHCSGGEQCHFVEVATSYVRGGAPDPTKPVLILDNDEANSPGQYDFVEALDNAFGAGVVPRVVMEPQSPEWAAEPLTTDRYSAILVASDYNCGGCDLNPPTDSGEENTADSDAINARKGAIEAFFNAGGGIYANAGDIHADGNASNGADVFYEFLPLPVGGVPVSSPFCLTPEGAELGFEDPDGCPDPAKRRGTRDDINCCATHNSFTEPDPSTALKVAERDVGEDGVSDASDVPETLFAEGIISGGRVVQPADLAITKVDSVDPARVGRNLTYTITVTNNGPATATNVTVTDDLPGSLTARSASASQGSCSGTSTVTCSLGQLANGASATVTIVVRPTSAGQITNTASVTASEPDDNTADNSASQETTVSPAGATQVDRRAPVVSVGGVRASGCQRSAFTARVSIRDASRLRRVVVTVDGRTIRRTRSKRFRITIRASEMRSGRHVLRVVATDVRGNRRAVSRAFNRCAPPVIAPILTG